MMDVFVTANMEMVSWVYVKVKTHPIVQCMRSVFHVNRTSRKLFTMTPSQGRTSKPTPDRMLPRVVSGGLGEAGLRRHVRAHASSSWSRMF